MELTGMDSMGRHWTLSVGHVSGNVSLKCDGFYILSIDKDGLYRNVSLPTRLGFPVTEKEGRVVDISDQH